MVGLYLQEVLHPSPAISDPAIGRIDYLGFNRITGRWDYLSMDTRASVGLMPAWSFDRDPVERIRVQFEPFALPGDDVAVSGRLLRMEQLIVQAGPDTDSKDQYFIAADGSGPNGSPTAMPMRVEKTMRCAPRHHIDAVIRALQY